MYENYYALNLRWVSFYHLLERKHSTDWQYPEESIVINFETCIDLIRLISSSRYNKIDLVS